MDEDRQMYKGLEKMKVVLYVRVSTDEQNLEMQKHALIEKVEREGWDYELFEEKESTRKTRPVKYELYQSSVFSDVRHYLRHTCLILVLAVH